MSVSTNHKRLDNIEVQLTPKQWALRYLDEIRKQPSVLHFLRSVAKGTMREAPFAKPYYNLAEQAQKSYPGNKPENVAARTQLARKLRKGFHALTLLIRQVNQDIALNTGTNRLKAELALSTLGIFILWDLLGRTARKAAAYIEEYKTDDSGKESERQAMLSELADCADMSLAEQSSDSLPPRTGSRTHFTSLIECWFQKFMMLLVDVYAQKAAVHAVEQKQFDGHPMLFRDVEARLDETIKTIEDTVVIFNEYLKIRTSLLRAERDQGNRDGIASAIPESGEGYREMDIQGLQRRATDRAVPSQINGWRKPRTRRSRPTWKKRVKISHTDGRDFVTRSLRSLDDLNELAGYVAAGANRAKRRTLRKSGTNCIRGSWRR